MPDKSMSTGYSTFSTISNEEHRIKRSRLNPFFSRKMVLELEDSIQSKTEKLWDLVAKKFSLNQPVDLHHGFGAVSVDIITDYAFNQCYDLLDRPDFGMEFFFMIQELGPMMWIIQQWPALQSIALSLPVFKAALQYTGGRKLRQSRASSNRDQLIHICLAPPPTNRLCKGRYGSRAEIRYAANYLPQAPDF
jgi:cytochrome P450